MKLILASGSPRRRELLTELGYDYTVFTADFNESVVKFTKPSEGVMALAEGKAIAAMEKYEGDKSEVIFLGSDTVVAKDDIILGKPETKEIATQVQEAQRVPGRINPRRNTLRHTVIKLAKIKDKEKL